MNNCGQLKYAEGRKNNFPQGWILIVHTSNIIETEKIKGEGFERTQRGAALGWVGGRKGKGDMM